MDCVIEGVRTALHDSGDRAEVKANLRALDTAPVRTIQLVIL